MRRRPHTLLATVVLMLALAPATAAAACSDTSLRPTSGNLPRQAKATLCLINQQRSARGLTALEADPRLSRAARRFANDMVRQQFFAHLAPSGETPVARVQRTGYLLGARAWVLAENIAWGAGTASTPSAVVRGWMRSPGHRAAILDARFRELGLGIALGAPSGGPGVTVTAEFGVLSRTSGAALR
jgi:uncharacterized protein YkwD